MIWLSTGHGSVNHNWIADNKEDRARFGGVAGTDQNVGEMILFEACERIAYFGPLAAADAQSVTLPKKLPPTPDDRLGSVKREQLAHDADGQRNAVLAARSRRRHARAADRRILRDVLEGRGMGQTRQSSPARGDGSCLTGRGASPPQAGGRPLGTGYYRNHIVGNHAVDGMTGIQLWISCIENVLAGNTSPASASPACSSTPTAPRSPPRCRARGTAASARCSGTTSRAPAPTKAAPARS